MIESCEDVVAVLQDEVVFLYAEDVLCDVFHGLAPVSTGRVKMVKLSVDCDHVKTQI